MKKNQPVICYILGILTIVLAIVSYFVLPDKVITQISPGDAPTKMSKIEALIIPVALGIGGALYALLGKGEKRSSYKGFFLSAVGIIVFIVMFVVNLK